MSDDSPEKPPVDDWVKQAPATFHLKPAAAAVCQKAASKRGISLEQWLGEAIWTALLKDHEDRPVEPGWFEKLGRDRRTQSLIGTLESMQAFLNVGDYSGDNVSTMKRLVQIEFSEWPETCPHCGASDAGNCKQPPCRWTN